MSADTSLEEIEARLDELRDEKQQARELGESFNEAIDALDDIRTDALIDSETAAKVTLLKDMLRHTRRFDVREHDRIHHERDHLRRQKRELKHAEEASL